MSTEDAKSGGNGGRFSGWIPIVEGTRIRIWSGQLVDAIEINGQKYGGNGGSASAIYKVDPGERLVEVDGRCGAYLDCIQFHFETESGQKTFTQPHGGNGGAKFSQVAEHILDIGFNYGQYVDCVWVRYLPYSYHFHFFFFVFIIFIII